MDAVIVWTDTEEKGIRSRQLKYIGEDDTGKTSETGRSQTGMLLTVAGILRYAPVNVVFLICAQEPSRLKSFLNENFPDRKDSVKIISHKELFEGFEGFLPCFSETAISTLIYRINSLSNEFLLFSPGCFPLGPMNTEAFQRNGISIIYGKIRKRGKIVSRRSVASPPANMPVLIRKKDLESCIASNHGLLARNMRYRFNSPQQTDILSIISSEGKAIARFHMPGTLIMKPLDDRNFRKLLSCAKDHDFISHSPLGIFPEAQKMALMDFLCAWMEIRL